MKFPLPTIFIISVLVCMATHGIEAQNDPNMTQWMFVRSKLNPAATALNKGVDFSVWAREQWWGLSGRPSTQVLTGGIFIPKAKSALGVSAMLDRLGMQQNILGRINYSGHITVSESIFIALGISAGIVNTGTRTADLFWQNPSEPLLDQIPDNKFLPEAGIGIEVFHKNWYVGMSGQHLIYGQISPYPAFARTLNLYFSYTFDIKNSLVKIVPSILGRSPFFTASADGNLLFYFLKDRFWLGGGYRYNDAAYGLAGVQIIQGLFLGYSYDYTLSKLRPFNTGSHELMLRFMWKKPRKPEPFFRNVRNY